MAILCFRLRDLPLTTKKNKENNNKNMNGFKRKANKPRAFNLTLH